MKLMEKISKTSYSELIYYFVFSSLKVISKYCTMLVITLGFGRKKPKKRQEKK